MSKMSDPTMCLIECHCSQDVSSGGGAHLLNKHLGSRPELLKHSGLGALRTVSIPSNLKCLFCCLEFLSS